MSNVIEGLKYSKDHEWVKIEGDIATVGITDYAQGNLGDIVFVELPEVDEDVEAGESVGNIESVKAVAEVFCPVSGTIVEVNENLEDQPELVNSDPYEGGWILKLKIEDGAADDLMDAAAYQELAK